MMRRIVPIAWLLTAAILIGASIGLATRANATPESDFYQTLMDGGVTIYDPGRAVTVGYAICDALNEANGEDLAWFIYDRANHTEIPSIEVARLWVVAAGTSLCPWQFHPERLPQGLAV